MYIKKETLHLLTSQPGVYQFLNRDETIIYVGKAKNLSKRVQSYFRPQGLNTKTLSMMQSVIYIKTICTASEHAALVLENQLIKKHRPKYNICLKDDKTYPVIYLTKEVFPKIGTSRGKKRKNVEYFGPYTNVRRAYQALDVAQKVFRVRTCRDTSFKNRSRACLLHQIGRCTGPCVNLVTAEAYKNQVEDLRQFLKGNHRYLIEKYIKDMHTASESLEFEKAAQIRDAIANMQNLDQQESHNPKHESIDIINIIETSKGIHFQITWIRDNKILDSKSYAFQDIVDEKSTCLQVFVQQYYANGSLVYGRPSKYLCADLDNSIECMLEDKTVLSIYNKSVGKSEKAWLEVAYANAQATIQHAQLKTQKYAEAFSDLEKLFNDDNWSSIECFDISHTQGSQTYASCVVFTPEGRASNRYRLYKLSTNNDDYQSMRESITRRYKKSDSPSLLLIDGGKGQLHAVQKTLFDLGIQNVHLMVITKDSSRKSGLEHYYTWSQEDLDIEMNPSDKAKRLLEEIRDEAHRFAITHHRKARNKQTMQDSIAEIPGIGEKKYSMLLEYFGGVKQLKKATKEQIKKVPGFSDRLTDSVYASIKLINKS